MRTPRRALLRASALSLVLGCAVAGAQELPAPAPHVDSGLSGLAITRIEIASSDPSWPIDAAPPPRALPDHPPAVTTHRQTCSTTPPS